MWARKSERSFETGFRYLIIHVVSGVLLLSGALMLAHETGSIAFEHVGLDGGWAGRLLLLSFGIKAGFPLVHNWITEAYPESTPTGTVFLSAFTTKVAVYALARGFSGTEELIYIGTAMTQELCSLYGAAPRDIDVEDFLNLSQSRVGKALPLTLAVAGNGLKAFPGVGTVAGGLVHAVAYGLIFDALGRSLVLTLTRHGELVPEVAAKEFEEGISEHIEAGVRRVASLALEEKAGGD